MLGPREHTQEATEHPMKQVLRILRRQIRNGRLLADDERKLGNQVHHHLAIRRERLHQLFAPGLDLRVAFAEQIAQEPLECLRKGGVRNVSLVLIELAGSKQPARRHQHFVQLVDDRRFADAGIARNQHEFGRAARDDSLERVDEVPDLRLAPIKFFGNQQTVRCIVQAERKRRNRMIRAPRRNARTKIRFDARRGLIAVFRGLGQQFQHDALDRLGNAPRPLAWRRRPARDMTMDPFHRVGCRERQRTRKHFVQNDAERIEIAAGVDRAIHSPRLLRRHVCKGARHDFRRYGRLMLLRQLRSDAKAGKTHAIVAIDQHMRRLDVFMYETALMNAADHLCEVDGDTQHTRQFERTAQDAPQRLAAVVVENQHGRLAARVERERMRRPACIEERRQTVLMHEARDTARSRPRGDQRKHRHGMTGFPRPIQ
ncbi:hypothetical protein BgramDRAFT_6103 [Paraburkholderia graminis C4D1M]|uniref:Uncharacterized protein n=1 Tax=Paraburkholderia graminis (strain ATCC 700544 / DSM 17151 / LMG 18924 / NCIMB 13744 / C4D1M) TaxID=396598 RepID=B1G9Q7_PARG4|nr:hypothetical protein BgramDRAFT_6103 [Paraburkholderia graminis C4D1M]